MDKQQTSLETSLGCGLLGCAGDAILGFLAGGLLLSLLALVVAVAAPAPAPMQTASPDLRLTIREDFLNRFIQHNAEDNVRVELLPGRQFNLSVDTSLSVLGASVPVQIVGLFELQLNGQAIEIRLLDTRVSDLTLPAELTHFFDEALAEINTELNIAVDNVSAALEIPLVFTGLGSDETTFWLEAREAQ
ncbi:MAG: hypothetical protein JW953_19065 [Anaerolineae bacterium]|nr:hypothetical protein [Anaerolineae bacterium]